MGDVRLPSDYSQPPERPVKTYTVADLPPDLQEKYQPVPPTRAHLQAAYEAYLTDMEVATLYSVTIGRVRGCAKYYKIPLKRADKAEPEGTAPLEATAAGPALAAEPEPREVENEMNIQQAAPALTGPEQADKAAVVEPEQAPVVTPTPAPEAEHKPAPTATPAPAPEKPPITYEQLEAIAREHPDWQVEQVWEHLGFGSAHGWRHLLTRLGTTWRDIKRRLGLAERVRTPASAPEPPTLEQIREVLTARGSLSPTQLARHFRVPWVDIAAVLAGANTTLGAILQEIDGGEELRKQEKQDQFHLTINEQRIAEGLEPLLVDDAFYSQAFEFPVIEAMAGEKAEAPNPVLEAIERYLAAAALHKEAQKALLEAEHQERMAGQEREIARMDLSEAAGMLPGADPSAGIVKLPGGGFVAWSRGGTST